MRFVVPWVVVRVRSYRIRLVVRGRNYSSRFGSSAYFLPPVVFLLHLTPLSLRSIPSSCFRSRYRSGLCSAHPSYAFHPVVVRRVLRLYRFRSVRHVGCQNGQ